MNKNDAIIKWLAEHRLFSVHGMCKLIKVDPSNFSRYISVGKLPEWHLDKVERVIKNYGFQIKK